MDGFQACAALEGMLGDRRDTLRDRDAGQAGAAGKRAGVVTAAVTGGCCAVAIIVRRCRPAHGVYDA